MGKIEVEDRTLNNKSNDPQEEKYVMSFVDYIISIIGTTTYLFNITFRETAIGLLTAGEIAMIVGEGVGKISKGDFQDIREKAKEYGNNRKKLLEEKGTLNAIKEIVNLSDKGKQ